MTKREKQLRLLRNQIKRQEHNRELGIKLLVRATLELPRLRKAEARLVTALLKRDNEIRRLSQLGPRKDENEKETRRSLDKAVEEAAKPDDDLGLPEFLRRGQTAQNAADEAARAEIEAQQAADKKRKTERRIKKLKIDQEIKQADLTGQRRKMPLTGKDALAAIRQGR